MDDLKAKYLGLIAGAPDEAAIEDVRVNALGKKGEIALLMRSLGQMSPEERHSVIRSLTSFAVTAGEVPGVDRFGWADSTQQNSSATGGSAAS